MYVHACVHDQQHILLDPMTTFSLMFANSLCAAQELGYDLKYLNAKNVCVFTDEKVGQPWTEFFFFFFFFFVIRTW